MRARAAMTLMAVVLLASSTAGVAAADQGTTVGPGGLASLLTAEQLATGGPAQFPGVPQGATGAGTSYFGPGGWQTFGPFWGYGPYPNPQTAAFFGATNGGGGGAWAGLLAGSSTAGLTSLFGYGPLATLNRTGLAPVTQISLASLAGFGVGTLSPGVFTLGGFPTPLPIGQIPANTTLGQLGGAPPAGIIGLFGVGGQ